MDSHVAAVIARPLGRGNHLNDGPTRHCEERSNPGVMDCHVATLLAMTDERGLAMTAGPWRLMGRGGLGVELDAQGGGDFEDGGETGVALS